MRAPGARFVTVAPDPAIHVEGPRVALVMLAPCQCARPVVHDRVDGRVKPDHDGCFVVFACGPRSVMVVPDTTIHVAVQGAGLVIQPLCECAGPVALDHDDPAGHPLWRCRMMTNPQMPHLAETMPPLRGRLQADAKLAPFTWFRVGGPAEVLVRPADAEDLAGFLRALPPEVPVLPIGAASNLIVRDGGVRGVVVRLTRGFGEITAEPDGVVAGAAALDATVAEHAAAAGLEGLEFLSGIPGSVGGAVAMNAGAYGGDLAQCLDWAEIVLRSGELVRVPADRLSLSYRHAAVPPDSVVVRARFRARPGDPGVIAQRMAAIRTAREATQPVRARTGGSTFRNPPDSINGGSMKAWELIDAAGCRGLVRGQAQVSEKHCNFLLNLGGATAADIEGLGEEVRRRVHAASGISLEWEIRRIGIPSPRLGVVA